jgi:protein-L-isoaspartate(D-aspartate) O-methyltransferase
MDLETARQNMIDRQLRTWEVLDARTLRLFGTLRREDFMPQDYRHLALADAPIPLAHGQITMTPKVEARILQALDPAPGDRALEIGTGCGFFTALLASTTSAVMSVDIFAEFTAGAVASLARCGLRNVQLATGHGARGWGEAAPYDLIAITGSLPSLAPEFESQLTIGGRLLAIVGQAPVMRAVLVTRSGQSQWTRETLFETELPPLLGLQPASSFRF